MGSEREGMTLGNAAVKKDSTIPPRAKLVRPRGAGTVTFEAGKWRARLPAPSRLTVALEDTQEEAERKLAAYTRAQPPGASLDAKATLLRDWMGHALDARESLRLRSVKTDRDRSRVHIERDAMGRLTLAHLGGPQGTAHVREWLKRMLVKVSCVQSPERAGHAATRLSARTVRNTLSLLRRSLQHALDVGLIDRNPAREVEVPRTAFASTRGDFDGVLEPDEQKRVLAVASAIDPFGVMLRVALGLGLRRGELLALRWVDIHLLDAEPFVVVRRSRRQSDPTKGGRVRRLPLFGVAIEALLAWRLLTMRARPAQLAFERYGEPLPRPANVPTFGEEEVTHDADGAEGDQLSRGTSRQFYASTTRRDREHDTDPAPPPEHEIDGAELVFRGRWGGERVKSPLVEFRACLAKAGVRSVRWHDLRHTCGTSLLMGWWGRKWSVAEVQKFLGHSSASVTEKYLHARNEMIFQAAREMRDGDAKGTVPALPDGRSGELQTRRRVKRENEPSGR